MARWEILDTVYTMGARGFYSLNQAARLIAMSTRGWEVDGWGEAQAKETEIHNFPSDQKTALVVAGIYRLLLEQEDRNRHDEQLPMSDGMLAGLKMLQGEVLLTESQMELAGFSWQEADALKSSVYQDHKMYKTVRDARPSRIHGRRIRKSVKKKAVVLRQKHLNALRRLRKKRGYND